MKKIEDYLKHYIGCDVMVTINADIAPKKAKLIGAYNIDQWQNCKHHPTVQVDFGRPAQRWCYLLSQVKLLLRPLSSMTKEEANLFFDFHYVSNGVFRWRNCIEVNKAGAEFVVNYESSCRNFRNVIKFDELNASDFHYLISRGFDLFGLIDANLALDATKIEKV